MNLFSVLAYGAQNGYARDMAVTSANPSDAAIAALTITSTVILLVIGIAAYAVYSYFLYKLGQKMGYKDSWFAFVPILNTVMILQLADMSPWLILVSIIPFIGGLAFAVILVASLYKIAEKNGKNPALAFLALVPIANLFVFKLIAPDDDHVPAEKKSDTVDKVLNE